MTHDYYRLWVYYIVAQLVVLISNHVTITLHYKVLWEVFILLKWDHGKTDKKLSSFLLRAYSSKGQCGSTFEFSISSYETAIYHPVLHITASSGITAHYPATPLPRYPATLLPRYPSPLHCFRNRGPSLRFSFPFLSFAAPKDIPLPVSFI